MWIDKDDIFTDDKVQEFKATNPDSEVHLRQAHIISIPHPHIPLSHHLHHHLISQPSMSSNGYSDSAYEPHTRAYSAGGSPP
jgi:hypothetical protein